MDPQSGKYVVAFEFDRKGAKKFAKVTTENTFQKRLAILLDDKVIDAPQIREPITGGSGNIRRVIFLLKRRMILLFY